jgi:N-acetylglucosaminyldiphosphoundecaprenol N-acetyl-beta-D-mannosaminyltransferase
MPPRIAAPVNDSPSEGVITIAVPHAQHARIDMMGLTIDAVSESETVQRAIVDVRDGRGGWICPANLDVLRQAVATPELCSLIQEADLVVADGMPLLWASRVQGAALPERVAGSSLIHTLSEAAARAGASVFLLGGDPGVAERAAARLSVEIAGLSVCGTHCPPVGFEQEPALMAGIESALRDARPDIVYVALGFPKQERLIRRLRAAHPSVWFVSVGASFSFVSGEIARAPRWMQRVGLEWVHRLAQEPRRLARRYLVDGIPFLVRVLASAARRRATSEPAVAS